MPAPALLCAIPLITGSSLGVLASVPERVALTALAIGWVFALVSLAIGRARLFGLASVCGFLAAGLVIGSRAHQASLHPSLLEWFSSTAPVNPVRLTALLREDA